MQTQPPQPADFLPQAAIAQFFYGAAYPVRAFYFIRQHRLWRHLLAPLLGHVALFFTALTLLDFYALPWLNLQVTLLEGRVHPSLEYLETVRVLWTAAHVVLWVVLVPISVVVAALTVLALGHFLCGPWLDLLAERVEGLVLQRAAKPFGLRRLVGGFLSSLADLALGPIYLLVVYLPMLLLSFLPGVGGLSTFFNGALVVAHQSFAPTLGRACLSPRARWAAVIKNRWLCGGFGAATLLLFLLPPISLLALPLATVGGTLLCCDLLRAGRIRPAG